MKTAVRLIVLVLLLSGCSLPDADPPPPMDTPVTHPSAEQPDAPSSAVIFLSPQPGDELLQKGQIFLDSSDILLLESFPVQVNLHLKGSLPTPCHQGRYSIQPPDADKIIRVELYSLSNPDQICVQVLQEFDTTLSLGTYPAGHYILLVNGESAGEFDL